MSLCNLSALDQSPPQGFLRKNQHAQPGTDGG